MANKKQQYVNEYGVKCYNQGFGKFGPMEHCTDGEWVRWSEVEPFLRAAEFRVMTSMEYEKIVQDHLEAYKRRIEEQAAGYSKKLKTVELENAKDRRRLLILNIGLVFVIALYSSGVLHA